MNRQLRILSVGLQKRMLTALLVLTALAWTASAHAQGYLTAGIHFPKQDAAPPSGGPYVVAPAGRTTGWFAGGGVYLNRAVAIDAVWTRTGVMSSVQTARARHFTLDLRDNFVSVGARFRLPVASHFTIEPVGGFMVIVRESWSQEDGGFPRLKSVETGPGLSFGVDARIGSDRVGVVPTLRFYLTKESFSSDVYPGGTERITIAPGIGMQVNF